MRRWLVPLMVVVITLATLHTAFVLNRSETVTSLVAVAISVDVVQRSILQPGARDAALLWLLWLLWLWWLLLVGRRPGCSSEGLGPWGAAILDDAATITQRALSHEAPRESAPRRASGARSSPSTDYLGALGRRLGRASGSQQ